jgi:hypothetical protein
MQAKASGTVASNGPERDQDVGLERLHRALERQGNLSRCRHRGQCANLRGNFSYGRV